MISFFANRSGSGEIRGRQMAEVLGARLNPKADYQDDVCIWVKRQPPEDFPPHSYLDVVDASERVSWLRDHPGIGVIASSLSGKRFLEAQLRRDVVYIPQHHCNLAREVNRPRAPLTIGVVGGDASVPPFGSFMQFKPRTREDTVKAYRGLDIQIIWRGRMRPLKNALKIINAASFGIPTVALPEPGFEEMEGLYTPAWDQTQAQHVISLWRTYGWDRDRLVRAAEQYHIEHIAERYRALDHEAPVGQPARGVEDGDG